MEIEKLVVLLKSATTIRTRHEEAEIASGGKFNIFSLLRMESAEVATHSRFIAELLNPKGQHGQKDKYLRIFLKLLKGDFKLHPESTHVYVEYFVGKVEKESGGRIDILLRDTSGNIIMLENKIYAKEQPNQLLRYHNAYPSGKLIYLTRFGENSKCSGSKSIQYEKMSYQTEILVWLEECLVQSANIPMVRETISQYINLVKNITNQNINKKMSKEIIEHILKSKEDLSSYKVLFDVHKDLKKELLKRIVQKMRLLVTAEGHHVEIIDFKHDRGLLISVDNPLLTQHHLAIRLNFEGKNFSNLIMGFYNSKGMTGKNERLFTLFRKEFPNSLKTDLYPAYIVYREYHNWYYGILNNIYFDDSDQFFNDFMIKMKAMLAISVQYNESFLTTNIPGGEII